MSIFCCFFSGIYANNVIRGGYFCFHRGCARIETNQDIDAGQLDIGFRYAVYLKVWQPRRYKERKERSNLNVLKVKNSENFMWSRKISSEISDDEKSYESVMSISTDVSVYFAY